MQLTKNPWFIPIVAMLIVFAISTARVYMYVDNVIKSYVESFRMEDEDYYIYWTFHSQELRRLILNLQEGQDEIKTQKADLAAWEARLKNEEEELARVKSDLEVFRGNLFDIITQTHESELKNLKSLASTYSVMDPSAAVEVFNEMDDRSVVKVLALMKADAIGPIFEAMISTPGMEAQMRARIARLSEKLRLYNQTLQESKR